MNQAVGVQETLRRLPVTDESFAEDQAGLALGLVRSARRRNQSAGAEQEGTDGDSW